MLAHSRTHIRTYSSGQCTYADIVGLGQLQEHNCRPQLYALKSWENGCNSVFVVIISVSLIVAMVPSFSSRWLIDQYFLS